MDKIKEFKEKFFLTNPPVSSLDFFKIEKKLFELARKLGLLDIYKIYDHLNQDPKAMDYEFIKMYLSRMSTVENHKPIGVFSNYWEYGLGNTLKDGIPSASRVKINDIDVFTSLVANNDIKEVIMLLEITENRLAIGKLHY